MSLPTEQKGYKSPPVRRKPASRLAALGIPVKRHASAHAALEPRPVSATTGNKAQRSSKTTQKLVVLPSAPQTKSFVADEADDLTLGFELEGGIREYKSTPERMTKEQRKLAGYKRITAYCIAESFKMKLLSTFLKREHNVSPRIFDEALYAMYRLPLLPGYGPNAHVRSSAPPKKVKSSPLANLSDTEDIEYFTTQHPPTVDGFISANPASRKPVIRISSPPLSDLEANVMSETDVEIDTGFMTEPEAVSHSLNNPNILSTAEEGKQEENIHDYSPGVETDPGTYGRKWNRAQETGSKGKEKEKEELIAEVVFFEYGVAVFFGLQEQEERDILDDLRTAGIVKRIMIPENWEIEEFHYVHDSHIAYPRIYNDFFTLKSHSHLLKLSIAHGLAQSTLLAHYEDTARKVLSSPLTLAIPTQLAEKGALHLRRHEALKVTGRLFKLRRDVNLVSNVLDTPNLFSGEASLKALYDAVREYMEIKPRVEVLNEKLGVTSDFLDAIHDHLNNNAMHRITWTVIWLIVAAIIVELGEIIARLIFHNSTSSKMMAAKILRKLLYGGVSPT